MSEQIEHKRVQTMEIGEAQIRPMAEIKNPEIWASYQGWAEILKYQREKDIEIESLKSRLSEAENAILTCSGSCRFGYKNFKHKEEK